MKISDIYHNILSSGKLEKSHRKIRHKAPAILRQKDKRLAAKLPEILNSMPASEVLFLADLIDTYELLSGLHGQDLLAETLYKRLAAQHAVYVQEKE
jgi:hypothetical protein